MCTCRYSNNNYIYIYIYIYILYKLHVLFVCVLYSLAPGPRLLHGLQNSGTSLG